MASSRAYYEHGSSARDYYSQPARREQPDRGQQRRTERKAAPRTEVRMRPRADRALAFNFGYTFFVLVSCAIMIAACMMMLNMEIGINNQQEEIVSLENQIENINNDNEARRIRLENMYSLDEIQNIAMNDMGMVYAKKGQIIYYDSAEEDYVNQVKSVPESK
ncbi:MAG: hypothetical protein IKO61_01950 [Lachnospiraceae bacterium]|nr:hypothetical protein [Lachnospiraceae bacterium]